jgi:hypothetical protein
MFINGNMTSPPPVVWINGFPGIGKLTVSRKIVELVGQDQILLIDNHQLIDPVKLPRSHPEYQILRKAERTKVFEKYVLKPEACPKIIIFTGECLCHVQLEDVLISKTSKHCQM